MLAVRGESGHDLVVLIPEDLKHLLQPGPALPDPGKGRWVVVDVLGF
jgi:hypothetical protein